jgi:CheY-like chemotaxis protein
MIVDDDEDIRMLSGMLARRRGPWEVVLAGDGHEALALAERERPDVILLDVMMPEQDGLATLARLREDPATARIPVIFVTAKAHRRELETYRALGAVGVIGKPFDVDGFADEIRRMVEGA